MKSYFVSDIHIQSPTDVRALRLERFLRRLVEEAAAAADVAGAGGNPVANLFLVGDIFDFWIGDHAYFRERYKVIVDLIRDLVRLRVAVHFFEGNHDLHLRSFWQLDVGVCVHAEANYFDLSGLKVRVEHGDLINPDDRGYLFLRWFLRTPVMRALALNLPEKLVIAIGERASSASRGYTSGDGAKALAANTAPEMIRAHAQRSYEERPFDLIISGHVHVRDDFEFEPAAGQRARSVNLGSWLDESESPRAFVLENDRNGAAHGEFVSIE